MASPPERLRVFIDADALFAGSASPSGASHLTLQLFAAGSADLKDAPILAAALASGCRWLVTFNIRDYRSDDRITAITPGDFVKQFREHLLALT